MHLGLDGYVAGALWITEFIVFILSVFWRPAIGLYVLIPLLPLQTIRYRLHGYFLGEQFIDVLLLGVILGLKRQGKSIIPKTPLTILLFIYIAFAYFSMVRGSFFLGTDLPLWFSNPRVSRWKNYVVDISLIFFVAVSAIRTRLQMAILLIAMCLGTLAIAKGFRGTMSGRDASTFSYDVRYAGPMPGAGVNGLAAFAAQVSVFLAGLYLTERRLLSKLGYLVTIAGAGYCLVWAFSRGAYAAFLTGMLFLGLARNRLILVGLLVLPLVWQGIVPTAVQERILMTTDENGGLEHSAATRVSLWEEAMQVFQADPIFGTGFATYAYTDHVGGYGDTHNVFVKVLVETGLVGLAIFLAILSRLFLIGYRLFRTADDPFLKSIGLGCAAMMVTAFIANMFGDRWMYFEITGYTYACAALATRAQQMVDEERASAEEAEFGDTAVNSQNEPAFQN